MLIHCTDPIGYKPPSFANKHAQSITFKHAIATTFSLLCEAQASPPPVYRYFKNKTKSFKLASILKFIRYEMKTKNDENPTQSFNDTRYDKKNIKIVRIWENKQEKPNFFFHFQTILCDTKHFKSNGFFKIKFIYSLISFFVFFINFLSDFLSDFRFLFDLPNFFDAIKYFLYQNFFFL